MRGAFVHPFLESSDIRSYRKTRLASAITRRDQHHLSQPFVPICVDTTSISSSSEIPSTISARRLPTVENCSPFDLESSGCCYYTSSAKKNPSGSPSSAGLQTSKSSDNFYYDSMEVRSIREFMHHFKELRRIKVASENEERRNQFKAKVAKICEIKEKQKDERLKQNETITLTDEDNTSQIPSPTRTVITSSKNNNLSFFGNNISRNHKPSKEFSTEKFLTMKQADIQLIEVSERIRKKTHTDEAKELANEHILKHQQVLGPAAAASPRYFFKKGFKANMLNTIFDSAISRAEKTRQASTLRANTSQEHTPAGETTFLLRGQVQATGQSSNSISPDRRVLPMNSVRDSADRSAYGLSIISPLLEKRQAARKAAENNSNTSREISMKIQKNIDNIGKQLSTQFKSLLPEKIRRHVNASSISKGNLTSSKGLLLTNKGLLLNSTISDERNNMQSSPPPPHKSTVNYESNWLELREVVVQKFGIANNFRNHKALNQRITEAKANKSSTEIYLFKTHNLDY